MDPNYQQHLLGLMQQTQQFPFDQNQLPQFPQYPPQENFKESSRDTNREEKFSQGESKEKKSRWDSQPQSNFSNTAQIQSFQPQQNSEFNGQSNWNNGFKKTNWSNQPSLPVKQSSWGQQNTEQSSFQNNKYNKMDNNKFQYGQQFNYSAQGGSGGITFKGAKKEMGANLQPIDWKKLNLEPFQKCFYEQTPKQLKKEQRQVEEYRGQHEIIIRNSQNQKCPTPFMEFSSVCLPEYIIQEIQKAGFKNPTPIQAQSWPILLKGCDLIGIARTGSGKSLAYIIPALIHINAQPPVKKGESPIVVIIAPTRELACQIQDECDKFGLTSNLNTVCCYGGVPKRDQVQKIKEGADLLVACPGRLIDIIDQGMINLKRVTYLVLDEADRMLDMGFEPQIRKILSQIRPDRQTCMWSATWPKEIQQLGSEFMINPIHIQIGDNSDLTANVNITQIIEVIPSKFKDERLMRLLGDLNADKCKVIVFSETKKGCETLSYKLKKDRWNCLSIHGDKTQEQRDYAIQSFKSGKINILCATDVAARGLDVSDIKFVINYDMSKTVEDYVHRIGRTGRANKSGVSYTMLSEESDKLAKKLVQLLEQGNIKIPYGLDQLVEEQQKNMGKLSDKIYTQIYMENKNEYVNLAKQHRM